MSSTRLFILDSFDRHGEMHGHQLRQLAERERVSLWTDISVGALYGAIKRLVGDGHLRVVRTEREGGFPERQIYTITPAGRQALVRLRADGLRLVARHPDPFDLALARLDPERLDDLQSEIEARLGVLRGLLADRLALNARAQPYLTLTERHALSHREHQLRADIEWHETLLAAVPAIVSDERTRQPAG